MSANAEPSLRNVECMRNTFIQMTNELHESGKLTHIYDFYNYYCNDDCNDDMSYDIINAGEHYKEISIHLKESIYHTYEKTVTALKAIIDSYDWIIRINISSYINIKLLDKFISIADENMIYCNAINSIINDNTYLNELYPRGDFIMFSNKTLHKIIPHMNKFIFCDHSLEDRIDVTHVDDCLLGCVIIDTFGRSYYKKLQLINYNYIPYNNVDTKHYNEYAIASRVKTLIPGVNYSGYSWKDNEFRKFDVLKMKKLNEIVQQCEYNNISLNDILVDEKHQRPTLFVSMANMPIKTFKEYLSRKNKGEN